MSVATSAWRAGCAALCGLLAIACGGGDNLSSGSSGNEPVTPAANVLAVVVDGGPGNDSLNTLFTTVTICAPGSTTNCQTIDHIQVDTGSYGLRVLSPILTATLPIQPAADGNSLLECTQFVDGYSWGPVALADVRISGETAANVPVQVIGDTQFPVPADCSSSGAAENTVAQFGANGILGIGVFQQDCGPACADATSVQTGAYYSCTTTACVATAASLTTQVLNPVPLFATDNNGVIVVLPSVAQGGAATVAGSVIFGIDTQSNNHSGTQKVLYVDTNYGEFTTAFEGQNLTSSFLDTGSNALFFNESSLTPCTSANVPGFYCPASAQNFSATLTGVNSVSSTASFTVSNAETIVNGNPSFTALPTLAGTYSSSTDTFDWGLPFYYGRRVYTAFEQDSTAVGTGPYVAF